MHHRVKSFMIYFYVMAKRFNYCSFECMKRKEGKKWIKAKPQENKLLINCIIL